VTFTEKVHDPEAAIEPPDRLTVPVPAVAVIVPPPQLPVNPLGVLMFIPSGKVSVKATPLRTTVVFGLEIVKFRVVVPESRIVVAPNALVIEGGATTVMLAVPFVPAPPLAEVIVTVLFSTPGVVPVTLTENEQLAPAARDAPVRVTIEVPEVAVIVPPPQLPVRLLGVDITNPAGTLSVTEIPVTVAVVLGFVTVKVSVAMPPCGIVEALKSLVIDGGSTTVSVAVLEVVPAPLSLAETAAVVLFIVPPLVPVTFIVMVQEVLAAREPPARFTEVAPELAVKVPPQVSETPGVAATANPAGNVSENETPVMAIVFGFVIVKVRVVVPFRATDVAPKDLVIVGGLATLILADAVLPVPPSFEETFPVVLFFTPTVEPVTFTLTVQEVLAATEPPVRFTEVAPALAVKGPPQVFDGFGGVATTNPLGKESVKVIPVRDVPLGFVMVKVREVVPLRATFAAPKAFEMAGGATTVRVADAVLPVPPLVEAMVLVVFSQVPAVVPFTFKTTVQEAPGLRLMFCGFAWLLEMLIAKPEGQVWLTRADAGVKLNPLGRVSVKLIPVSIVVVLGFVITNVMVVLPFNGMDVAPKVLESVGGPITVSVAVLEVVPVPPSFELIAPVVLFLTPAVVPVTFTEIWQFALAAKVAPDRFTEVAPDVAVKVPVQVVEMPGLDATANPAGSESVKEMPVEAAVVLGFAMVKVRVVVPFTRMDDARNALLMVGGVPTTRVADAVLPVPPSADETFPVTLFLVPLVAPVTFTETVQAVFAPTEPPARETAKVAAMAATVPPQVFDTPGGVATANPEGKLSEKAS
jgi:hypothetical protein